MGCPMTQARTTRGICSCFRRFCLGEDGTTAVEYAVVLALIVISAYSGVAVFSGGADTVFSNSDTEINSHLNGGGGS